MAKRTDKTKILAAINLYEQGASYAEMAEVLSVDPKNVARTLRTAGYQVSRRQCPAYPINERFFDKLTPESAYVLGLVYADGSLEAHHSVRLYSSDRELLEMVGQAMDLERNVEGPFRRNYRLSINSRRITAKLRDLGLTEHKLGTMLYPTIPQEVERDFIRGFFDGDGHVSGGARKGAPIVNFAHTSLPFMEGLVVALARHGIINQTVHLGRRPQSQAHNPGYIIEFRNWHLFYLFRDLLYGHKPSLFLERKRERFFRYDDP